MAPETLATESSDYLHDWRIAYTACAPPYGDASLASPVSRGCAEASHWCASLELFDLESAVAFDHGVENLFHHVGIDQVAGGLDDFLLHRGKFTIASGSSCRTFIGNAGASLPLVHTRGSMNRAFINTPSHPRPFRATIIPSRDHSEPRSFRAATAKERYSHRTVQQANPPVRPQNILPRLRFFLVDSNRATVLWFKPYDCPDTIRNGAADPAQAGEKPAYRARLRSSAYPGVPDGLHAGLLALGLRHGTRPRPWDHRHLRPLAGVHWLGCLFERGCDHTESIRRPRRLSDPARDQSGILAAAVRHRPEPR